MNKASPASEITEKLRDWSDNHRADSADALLKLVYDELRLDSRFGELVRHVGLN